MSQGRDIFISASISPFLSLPGPSPGIPDTPFQSLLLRSVRTIFCREASALNYRGQSKWAKWPVYGPETQKSQGWPQNHSAILAQNKAREQHVAFSKVPDIPGWWDVFILSTVSYSPGSKQDWF